MNTPFRTLLPLLSADFQIKRDDRLMLLGSCFTEHIGRKLEDRKFKVGTNPFGIVYNPISMAHTLEKLAAGNSPFVEEDLFENAGLWHSWEHHGRFSNPDKMVALKEMNAAYRMGTEMLQKTDILLLTFGTAQVFTLSHSGQVVANNHKMLAAHFKPRRLSVSEVVEHTLNALERVAHQRNSSRFQVILTVSPVRHLRDGLIENQRSKAILLLACEEICRHLKYASYFPAYELLIDDLRDYRFYAADMIHPSEVAVDYVWQFFSDTYFSEQTCGIIKRIEKIKAAANHLPFHPDTPQHQAFVQTQLEAIAALKLEWPELDFSVEEASFHKKQTH